MITVNINQMELNEFTSAEDPKQHCRANFPMLGAHGTKDSATVYFEIEPGENLGRHTDSAEELLMILEGDVEVSIGEEKGLVSKGSIALVPKMIPHDIKNVGSKVAKVAGFFGGANNITATFEKKWDQAPTNEINTAVLFQEAV